MPDENNNYSILPFIPDQPTAPSFDTQQEVLDNILAEFVSAMTAAEKAKDPMEAVRIMVRCEKILDAYTSEGFTMLTEYQRELQSALDCCFRTLRRKIIRDALLAPQKLYDAVYRDELDRIDGPGAADDFHAVEAHLDFGQSLNEGLLKRQRN